VSDLERVISALDAVLHQLPALRKARASDADAIERQAWKARADLVDAVRELQQRAEAAEAKAQRYEQLETRCNSNHRHTTIHDAFCCDLMLRRAEAAEAALAAVPVDAWRTLLSGENVSVESGIRAWNAVRDWLSQQDKAQP